MAESRSVETFLAGLMIGGVIGGVVGAGLALLFAPASGKETREFIRTKAAQALDEGKEEFEKIRHLVQEEVKKLLEKRQTAQSEGTQLTQEAESAG